MLRRKPGADDPHALLLWLRVDHDDDPALDRTDCDEAILPVGMVRAEDLEVVDARFEELLRLAERKAVPAPAAAVFRRVPIESDDLGG